MARPLRLEYPGALYHVTSRGNRREKIFNDDVDHQFFFDLFGKICARLNWRCYAYCHMTNHYHLVVETAKANLSAGMRQLNGVYAQRFNRRHQRVGHLLQGRYSAILVDKDEYLMELARYVVLNPVRTGMVLQAGQWRWSSYSAMIRRDSTPRWLARRSLLGMFASNEKTACKRYIRFISNANKVPDIWNNLRHRLILGDEKFIERVMCKCDSATDSIEVPRLERQALAKPLSFYKRQFSDQREAMRAAYNTGLYTLAEIARHFGVHYSTVSRAARHRRN